MSQVDPLHATARAVPSAEPEPVRADEPFDAVLAFVSRTSAASTEDVNRARRFGGSIERHRRMADVSADQTRTGKLRERHRENVASKDSRVDGLRAQAEQARRSDTTETTSADVRQASPRDTQASATQPNRGGTDQPNGLVTSSAGTDSANSGFDQQTGPFQDHGGEQGNPPKGHDSKPATPQTNETTGPNSGHTPQASRQTGFATRDTQAAQTRSGDAVSTLKQAGTTAKATASADFQNLMAMAARQRGPAGKAILDSALTSKASPHQVLNPKDAASFDELARIVRSNIGQKHSSLVMRLDPPELGKIRIDMRMHDQTLTLRIEAQTHAGQQALQSRLADLRSALEQHGIQLSRVDVELREPTPTNHPEDARDQNSGSSPWDEGATNGSWDQPAPHDGRHADHSTYRPFASDPDAFDITNVGETEHDDVTHLAETGVDVVV